MTAILTRALAEVCAELERHEPGSLVLLFAKGVLAVALVAPTEGEDA